MGIWNAVNVNAGEIHIFKVWGSRNVWYCRGGRGVWWILRVLSLMNHISDPVLWLAIRTPDPQSSQLCFQLWPLEASWRGKYRQSLSKEAIEVNRVGWILLFYFKTEQWWQPDTVRDISSVVYLSVIGCFNLLVRRHPPLRQAHTADQTWVCVSRTSWASVDPEPLAIGFCSLWSFFCCLA